MMHTLPFGPGFSASSPPLFTQCGIGSSGGGPVGEIMIRRVEAGRSGAVGEGREVRARDGRSGPRALACVTRRPAPCLRSVGTGAGACRQEARARLRARSPPSSSRAAGSGEPCGAVRSDSQVGSVSRGRRGRAVGEDLEARAPSWRGPPERTEVTPTKSPAVAPWLALRRGLRRRSFRRGAS